MESVLTYLKRILRPIARRYVATIVREELIEQGNALKSRLAKCEPSASLRMPSVIEHPERVSIGHDVSIASFLHVWGNGTVSIGDRTMIASHVAITSATHDPNSRVMYQTLIERPVVIENDVWIGAHAVILPGVRIGEHSVIGAGSLVNSDVEPYSVVAGTPAKTIYHKQATCGG